MKICRQFVNSNSVIRSREQRLKQEDVISNCLLSRNKSINLLNKIARLTKATLFYDDKRPEKTPE